MEGGASSPPPCAAAGTLVGTALRFVQQLPSQTSVSLWFSQMPFWPPFGFCLVGRSFSFATALVFSLWVLVELGVFFMSGGYFLDLPGTAPKIVLRPPRTSCLGMRSLSRIGFFDSAAPSRGAGALRVDGGLFGSTHHLLTRPMPGLEIWT